MDETYCKVGDEYYLLIFNKSTATIDSTKYEGELLLDAPLQFQILISEGDEILNFEPTAINPDIITAIKNAIDDYELKYVSMLFK